jgi:hypothetical protein
VFSLSKKEHTSLSKEEHTNTSLCMQDSRVRNWIPNVLPNMRAFD